MAAKATARRCRSYSARRTAPTPRSISSSGSGPRFGATIALRRETLEEIGGFEAFADCLADDYAIGQAVRNSGLGVALPAFSVGHVCFEQTAAELVRHQMRQSRTIRSIDPVGYA